MDSPRGHVVSLRTAAGGERVALVNVDAMPTCARCEAGKGCGAGLFSSRDSHELEAHVPPEIDVAEGDGVRIEMGGRALLPAALIVYGWPLAGAAVGALVATSGPLQGDAAAAAGAMLGLVVAGVLAHFRLASDACLERFRPIVVERAMPRSG